LRVTTEKPLSVYSRLFLLGNVTQFFDNFGTRLKPVALTETLFFFLATSPLDSFHHRLFTLSATLCIIAATKFSILEVQILKEKKHLGIDRST
jgi:hypothetical protein